MTAYGRSSVMTTQGRLTIEIQTINRKFLDLQLFLPKEFARFDSFVRKMVSERVFRGLVTVRIEFHLEGKSPLKVTPNFGLIQEYLKAFQQVQQTFNIEESLPLSYLLSQPDVFLLEQSEEIGQEFEGALQGGLILALEELLQMKLLEGKYLETDLLARVELMQKSLELISQKAPFIKTHYKKKLVELLEEIIPGGEHEERLLREVCLFAEKVDIEEELTRFSSHLLQMKALFSENRETSGKTLEFLVQELQREANTMGAKASDIEVGKIILELKGEIERIREQIHNVE